METDGPIAKVFFGLVVGHFCIMLGVTLGPLCLGSKFECQSRPERVFGKVMRG